jgi:hypothetical protein
MSNASRPRTPDERAARRNFAVLCAIALMVVIALVVVTAVVTAT